MLILLTADNIMLFQVAANSQTKPTNLVLSPPIGCYLPHLPSPLTIIITHPYIRLHPLNGPLSGTSEVSQYQKGKTNLDFTGARDSGWQWHQLGHMQVCTSLQTDNHASTPPLSFLRAGCPSCRPANSVKALKALLLPIHSNNFCVT